MTRLLIMGAPGAGKGTQAKRIAEKYQVPAISTGDIFRFNIKNGTELGKIASSYIDKGEYVPDEVTDSIVKDRLLQDDAQEGFLLDGYPRTIAQVHALDSMLAESDLQIDAVILITVDEEAVVSRLLRRAEIEDRPDDTEPVIRHRLQVFHEATQPLIDVYKDRGVIVSVDGMGEMDEVFNRIVDSLELHLAR